jgi:hypothetical protein
MLASFTSRFRASITLLFALLLLASAVSLAAQDALTKARADYASRTNPVDKAKSLAKLASREMTDIRDMARAGEDEKALAALQRFRDEVSDTTRALVATGVDASRKSGGFKELQISLRMFIRRLDDLILSLQQDDRPAFRAVRADLETAQNMLIDALFPATSPQPPATGSSK